MPLLVLLIALALCGCNPPVEPEASPPLPPVLRFVGVCDYPALWLLRRDDQNIPPTGIWMFWQTDSLDFVADSTSRELFWVQLDPGSGHPLQGERVALDSLGTGRIEATCLSE